jgi:F-type H+-transporting ATPase subunit epsilon
MSTFTLEIKSPEKSLFFGKVTSLTVKAVDGEIGILADHAPLVSRLAPGPIKYHLESGEEVSLDGGAGFLLVKANQANVLLT